MTIFNCNFPEHSRVAVGVFVGVLRLFENKLVIHLLAYVINMIPPARQAPRPLDPNPRCRPWSAHADGYKYPGNAVSPGCPLEKNAPGDQQNGGEEITRRHVLSLDPTRHGEQRLPPSRPPTGQIPKPHRARRPCPWPAQAPTVQPPM